MRIGAARDARQARPTGNRDDLVQPWLYAIVALVLVEDHAADRCAPTPCMPASDA